MSHIPAERCLSIIELLADRAHSLPLGEIAERLSLPKSGAHRLLATLIDVGWVQQDPGTNFYRLTMRLAILGQQFYVATGIPDLCQPVLDRIAKESREFVRLAVVDGRSLVWVAHAQGASGGLIYQPTLTTNTVPLYATASGKAWLATLSPEQAVENVVHNGGFKRAGDYGPNVIRSMEALLSEIKTTRKRGFGIAVNEAEFGVSAVAAPVRAGKIGSGLGTVSIAAPSARMSDRRIQEMARLVLKGATELSDLWPLRSRGTMNATPAGAIEAA